MKKTPQVVLIVVILVACVALGIYLVSGGPSDRTPETPPPTQSQAKEPPAGSTQKVKVYRVAVEDNQPKLRPTEQDVKAGEDPAEVALRRLIEQGDSADLANPIPEGTRLLSLKVEDGLATVDLSREFKDNFTGGSEEEGLTVGAVLRTLGQFPDIKQVLFLVDGRPLETLGHLDLSGPQDVNWVGSQFTSEE